MDPRCQTSSQERSSMDLFGGRLHKVSGVALLVVILAVTLGYFTHLPTNVFVQKDCTTTENITLRCLFKPLTMQFDNAREMHVTMRGLLKWQNPHKSNITLMNREFLTLLPSSEKHVGDVWYIIEPVSYPDEDGKDIDDLKLRYQDMKPSNDTAASVLHSVLSMFHKNVFLQTRFAPRGTIAVLRAQTSDILDIVFRCHAEFQLNYPPLLPFWFTPAQFQGQLVIKRDLSEIFNFTVNVPTYHKLNVDMEWVENLHQDMVVDVGFIPQMLIHIADKKNHHHISWNEEITINDAFRLLEQKMFPFKEVLYKPITAALDELSEQNKLLHCIVLWGALDDQSC